jgi:type III secretion protein T
MDIEPFKIVILTMGLCVVRILAIFMVLPIFGQESIPGTIRTGVVLSFSLVVFPLVAPTVPAEGIPLILLGGLLFKEIVVGVLLGFFFSIPFRVAEGIGFVIDNQRGTGMAAVFDPMAGGEVTPLAVLLLRAVIVLFVSAGGMLVLFKGILLSYQVYPVVSAFPSFQPALPLGILSVADKIMASILILTAPVMIALFTSEFGLGLVNRFAPALNVFFLAMPIKSAIAVLMLALMMPTLVDTFLREFADGDRKMLDFLGILLQPVEPFDPAAAPPGA